MKKFTLLASLLMFVMLSYAANVIPVETAMKASKNFLAKQVGTEKARQMELVLENTEYSPDGVPVTYRFRVGEKGFIIVSATELASPVLAFSLESEYKGETGADVYNEMYTKSLSYLMNNPSDALPMRSLWDYYLAPNFQQRTAKGGNASGVEPLITTKWTQEKYYNTMCPLNPQSTYDPEEGRAVVGCVALTMANILYYYRYPEQGTGVVSYIPREYDHSTQELIYTYPAQTVNYGQAIYDYNAMSDSLKSYDGELAKLIYHCGVSVRMSYGSVANEGSGSQSEYALDALQTHYKFSDKGQYQLMSDVAPSEDLMYEWVNKARTELDARRPLFYSGHSTTGGHAWIVDGYFADYVTTIDSVVYTYTGGVITDSIVYSHISDSTFYFHVNWGWHGDGNGYFLINNQNSTQGAFTNDNSMMVKLMPDSAEIQKPAESFTRVTSSFGTISDGAGNMKYAPNSNRRWVLACPDATSYQFKFSKLKVKNGDEVVIYNGPTETSGVKGRYTGNYLMAACSDYTSISGCVHGMYTGSPLPESVTVNADSVLVVFTSNADDEVDYGFVLQYQVNSFSQNACTNKTYHDQDGVLTDKPNNAINDELYRLQNACEYQLDLYWVNQLVYSFPKFDLKAGDYVDIYNQTGSSTSTRKLVAHYDINNLPSQVYTLDAPSITSGGQSLARFIVRFASDNKDQGTGFELNYYGVRTGISQYDNVEVNVYPNPASSYVNVDVTSENPEQFKAEVVDMMGKTVYVDQFNHNGGKEVYQIPVNNLAKGVYFLHLNSANGNNIQKFIVQ